MHRENDCILAIDAGTTGVRAILFDRNLREKSSSYSEFRQYFPKPGWVEHDAREIQQTTIRLIRQATSGLRASEIAAVGITNQRETIVCWEAGTLRPLYRAIVWQCRRTTEICEGLKKRGLEKRIQSKTGLVLDPYFSGSKISWLLKNVPAVQRAAKRGTLRIGTIDSWLIACLTQGRSHVTDASNAARTLLYNIHQRDWDDELLKLFHVRREFLPQVLNSAADFGTLDSKLLGSEIPITGVIGDQQAALYGQACWETGQSKITYGTGCFWMLNTGNRARAIPGFLTTLAADRMGKPCYALEGAVFIGGAVIQWLRDSLQAIRKSSESESVALSVPSAEGVYFIPAFVGLGAPYWNPNARGAIVGLTRGSTRAHIVRAALESIAYQNAELISLVQKSGTKVSDLRVDGGASRNNFLMQFQSDLLGLKLTRPSNLETTALGAAALAAVGSGFMTNPSQIAGLKTRDREFRPKLAKSVRAEKLANWKQAVQRVL